MKKKIVQSFQAEKSLHSHLKLETWLIDRRYLDIPSSSFFPIFVFDWQISANKLKDINRFVSMLFAYDWLYIKDYIIWVCFLSFHNSIVEESTRNHIVNVTKQCTAVKCSNEVKKRRIMHRKTNVWRDGEKKNRWKEMLKLKLHMAADFWYCCSAVQWFFSLLRSLFIRFFYFVSADMCVLRLFVFWCAIHTI